MCLCLQAARVLEPLASAAHKTQDTILFSNFFFAAYKIQDTTFLVNKYSILYFISSKKKMRRKV
jgi:hypothetical protein